MRIETLQRRIEELAGENGKLKRYIAGLKFLCIVLLICLVGVSGLLFYFASKGGF